MWQLLLPFSGVVRCEEVGVCVLGFGMAYREGGYGKGGIGMGVLGRKVGEREEHGESGKREGEKGVDKGRMGWERKMGGVFSLGIYQPMGCWQGGSKGEKRGFRRLFHQ